MTKEQKDAILFLLDKKLDNLSDDLDTMSKKDRWGILNALSVYVIPDYSKNNNYKNVNEPHTNKFIH